MRRDVFCYFDNDQKVEAPFDAARLKARLDGTDEAPRPRKRRAKAAPAVKST
jgi:uncharacterized protein YecE (DUF72 family)